MTGWMHPDVSGRLNCLIFPMPLCAVTWLITAGNAAVFLTGGEQRLMGASWRVPHDLLDPLPIPSHYVLGGLCAGLCAGTIWAATRGLQPFVWAIRAHASFYLALSVMFVISAILDPKASLTILPQFGGVAAFMIVTASGLLPPATVERDHP